MDILDFPDFVGRLQVELHLDVPDPPTPEVGLFDDLELDSLGAFELVVTVEDLAAADIPPMDPPEMYTLGDVYAYYLQLTEGSPHGTLGAD
jgi:acyl carrier protein